MGFSALQPLTLSVFTEQNGTRQTPIETDLVALFAAHRKRRQINE